MSIATSNVDLQRVLTGSQLPALPQSAIRLLELSQNPDRGPAEFAVPIEADPGLTGQVLRFVNSSYFGFTHEISSVKLAISLVGIRTIKNFVLWSAVFSLMPNPKCGPFELKSLWQDSLRRAIFARALAKVLGVTDAEDIFAAALLQDMAVPMLAKELPAEYKSLLVERENGAVRLSELEQRRFGWTHAKAAGMIARCWSLPESFANVIDSHTELDEQLARGETNPAALAISLSSLLPSTCDTDWFEREPFSSAYSLLTGPHAPTARDLFELVDNEFGEFAPILKLSVPGRLLVDYLGK